MQSLTEHTKYPAFIELGEWNVGIMCLIGFALDLLFAPPNGKYLFF